MLSSLFLFATEFTPPKNYFAKSVFHTVCFIKLLKSFFHEIAKIRVKEETGYRVVPHLNFKPIVLPSKLSFQRLFTNSGWDPKSEKVLKEEFR